MPNRSRSSRPTCRAFFGEKGKLTTTKEWETLDAYYNLDNGTGKVRGVYTQENWAIAPIFKQWIAPLADLGVSTISYRNTGGTDHLSFDAVGLPGFQYIQDPMDYDTRTHHSDMDTFDRLHAADLEQAAVVRSDLPLQHKRARGHDAAKIVSASRAGAAKKRSHSGHLPKRSSGSGRDQIAFRPPRGCLNRFAAGIIQV